MIRCSFIVMCLLLTKVLGQTDLSIDLCKTDEKQEDCSKTMKIDEISNYPFTQMDERLYFKISDDRSHSDPNVLQWPYNCYLLGVEGSPSPENIIVEKGCPTYGQMSITMETANPIKVGFVLSRIPFVGSKTVQESMYIKCNVAICRKGVTCPTNHCGSNSNPDTWDTWRGRTLTAVSKGYLFLDNFHAIPPPALPSDRSDKTLEEKCQLKMKELRNQCGMYVNELLLFPNEKKK